MLFLELDHAAQLNLLERLARAALAEHYADLAEPGLVLSVQQYEDNAVWRADTGDGRSYVVRLSVRDGRTPDQQRAEMRWLHSLSTAGAVPVPAPVPTASGDHVVPVEVPWHDEACTLAALTWLPGTAEPPFRERGVTRAIGEVTARLHENSATVPLADFDRPAWDGATVLERGHALTNPTARALLGADGVDLLRRITDQVMPVLARGPDLDRGRIHGDLHRENLLALPDGGIGMIDFDDCGTGHYLLDVATVLSSIHRLCRDDTAAYAGVAREFLSGYADVRALPADTSDLLDAYLVLRDGFILNFVTAAIPVNDKVADWGLRRITGILADMHAYLDMAPYPGSIRGI